VLSRLCRGERTIHRDDGDTSPCEKARGFVGCRFAPLVNDVAVVVEHGDVKTLASRANVNSREQPTGAHSKA